jgi:integrase
MSSIRKRNGSWVADIRRKGHKSISKSFPTKTLAQTWARKVEREMDTMDFKDGRSISTITLSELIDRYSKEIGDVKPFGRNKTAVLKSLKKDMGSATLSDVTVDRLTEHIRSRVLEGAGGVTIAIELTYLGSVYKAAKQLWKMPIDMDVISSARSNMSYMGLSTKSKERDRRPTGDEINRICAWFDGKPRQKVPMSDLIRFAIASAMRAGEIINLKWDDLNEADRTVIIRDRKHPQEKKGNDQEVPLLGDAFTIAMRQPRDDDRIFPVADGTISSLFPRACNALSIEDLHFHDLRHEGVSRLFEQGYRIEQVALVSGHRDWKMLSRYVQLKAKDLHR